MPMNEHTSIVYNNQNDSEKGIIVSVFSYDS